MTSKLFINAINRIKQPTPPIWFMRQAGRYHNHYQKLKEKYSFEELCKIPDLASEVACGPVNEFDFDLAILFSDILFPLEGLGMSLSFNPGPQFKEFINKDNVSKFSNIEKAIEHMEFKKKAIELTLEKLPPNKSLIGFVGGLWTLFRFATNKNINDFKFEKYHSEFIKNILLPLIKKNIELQIEAGAEVVMIFDSGLLNIDKKFFESQYIFLIKNIAETFPKKIGYYAKGKNLEDIKKLFDTSLAGIALDSTINIKEAFSIYKSGFIQGNFDESKLLLNKSELSKEINEYCDSICKIDNTAGWVCGLGHGINKNTPEENVHLFIDIIRKRFNY